jgi:hypothetical protein
LRTGIAAEIEFASLAGANLARLEVIVRDAQGGVVLRTVAWPHASPIVPVSRSDTSTWLQCTLAEGSYMVAATGDELRGSGAFTVAAPAPARAAVALTR